MNRWKTFAGALVLCAVCSPAFATVNIFACLPEWAALATELGGNKVSVYQASNALQDPHRIEARPSLVAHMRSADLAICTGAELEIGWLPVLQQTAGNQKVQPGQPGFIAAADFVDKLEVPTRLDRADGDVHPAGNPHIQRFAPPESACHDCASRESHRRDFELGNRQISGTAQNALADEPGDLG